MKLNGKEMTNISTMICITFSTTFSSQRWG